MNFSVPPPNFANYIPTPINSKYSNLPPPTSHQPGKNLNNFHQHVIQSQYPHQQVFPSIPQFIPRSPNQQVSTPNGPSQQYSVPPPPITAQYSRHPMSHQQIVQQCVQPPSFKQPNSFPVTNNIINGPTIMQSHVPTVPMAPQHVPSVPPIPSNLVPNVTPSIPPVGTPSIMPSNLGHAPIFPNMAPCVPMTPTGTPLAVPPPSSVSPFPTSPPSNTFDIPDLRQQFLQTQYVGQPGQVVVMPPLGPDRSVQTIQILTPLPGLPGQHSVQTIVLPIMKLGNSMPSAVQQQVVLPPPKFEDNDDEDAQDNIINDDDLLLNKIDSTGLPKVMQGIDLDQVNKFASEFKSARISLGLTQTQVGQALNKITQDDSLSVSQSTICRFEKLEITALQVKKLLPALQSWLTWARQRQADGLPVILHDGEEVKEMKKRKRRTVFNHETVTALNTEFDQNNSPSSCQMADIADRLGLDKETTRVWFCNKRQQIRKSID